MEMRMIYEIKTIKNREIYRRDQKLIYSSRYTSTYLHLTLKLFFSHFIDNTNTFIYGKIIRFAATKILLIRCN